MRRNAVVSLYDNVWGLQDRLKKVLKLETAQNDFSVKSQKLIEQLEEYKKAVENAYANTRLMYFYEDGFRYRFAIHVIVKGILTDEQKGIIRKALNRNLYFIPEEIGLPCKYRFTGAVNAPELDNIWCELPDQEASIQSTFAAPTIQMTASELVKKFQDASAVKWNKDFWLKEFMLGEE